MLKIKVCTQNPEGPCAYYRSLGVLSKLSKISNEHYVQNNNCN